VPALRDKANSARVKLVQGWFESARLWFGNRKDSSFSEEKEAKRLFYG
jgi:hypothetical protein